MDHSLGETDLELVLFENDSLWNSISCGKFSQPLFWIPIPCLQNNNIRYCVYFVFLFTLEIMTSFTNSVMIHLIAQICAISMFTMALLECNICIFKQSLVTFNVYYKTINILIALIAYQMDYGFFKEQFSSNGVYNNSLVICYLGAIFSVVKSTLNMFIISLSDGYCVHQNVRIFIIIIYAMYLCYFYYFVVYFRFTSLDVIGYVFGYSFHWQTIAISTMNSAIIFLLSQTFGAIIRPNKLLFMQTFIAFKKTDRASKQNEISINGGIESNKIKRSK